MRDVRAMMFALSSSVSYESMTKGGNVVFPAVGKDNEAGIIICSFHTVGIAVGRAGLVSYYGLAGNIPFGLLAPVSVSIMVCHKKSFQLLVGEQLFHPAVLSSRTIAEGVLQLRYTASKLECMPSSVSERLKESILNRWI